MTQRTEANDPFCLTPPDADVLLSAAPWTRFAALGDSIVEGLGEPLEGYGDAPWVDRVGEALRRVTPGFEWRNFGRRYLRAGQVREEQLQAALDFNPDLACVFCGGNDLMTLEPVDLDAVEQELDAMVGTLVDHGATVLTFTLQDIWKAYPELPQEPLRPRIESLNDIVRKLSDRHGALLVEQRDFPPVADTDIYASDMLHPSARGHAVVASLVVQRLAASLGAATPGHA